jgi:hypothetical protein
MANGLVGGIANCLGEGTVTAPAADRATDRRRRLAAAGWGPVGWGIVVLGDTAAAEPRSELVLELRGERVGIESTGSRRGCPSSRR